MNPTPDFQALSRQFQHDSVRALALMGSFARGDAGPHSDVDLVRFLREGEANPPGNGSHLIHGRLVVVSHVSPPEIVDWFRLPEKAVEVIAGLRAGRALFDPEAVFARIQQRARDFVWEATMQAAADAWASRQMVGWIEEVHKALEGLRRNDSGRLLNAKHGLTWGMARVMSVKRGLLLRGDNAFYEQILEEVGRDSAWAISWQQAFAVGAPLPLPEQIRAGLRVYVLTAVMLDDILRPEDAPLIRETVGRIREFLN